MLHRDMVEREKEVDTRTRGGKKGRLHLVKTKKKKNHLAFVIKLPTLLRAAPILSLGLLAHNPTSQPPAQGSGS